MIPQQRLEAIAEGDLRSLIANQVAEGKTVEYKQQLPGGSDSDKKEFLADVSSFANTGGGDLVLGMTEQQGVPTGIPGLTSGDLDLELQRLDSIISSGLEPRIRYATKFVDCGGARVLIVRIEKSWIGPHRVKFQGHDKFYGRNSTGKYPLDVEQLRVAFTQTSALTDRIRAFRAGRIISLVNNETPVPFVEGPKLVLHCIPLESFTGLRQYDILRFYETPELLPALGTRGGSQRINLEGVLTVSRGGGDSAYSYAHLYRIGLIEAVNGNVLAREWHGASVIPSIAYEEQVIRYLPQCFKVLANLGCGAPVLVALTLIGVRGLRMGDDPYALEIGQPIDRDTLTLPETVVEDLNSKPENILRPMFDLVWNACGYPRSRNFDADGNWLKRR
jgi:hypothetical protein